MLKLIIDLSHLLFRLDAWLSPHVTDPLIRRLLCMTILVHLLVAAICLKPTEILC